MIWLHGDKDPPRIIFTDLSTRFLRAFQNLQDFALYDRLPSAVQTFPANEGRPLDVCICALLDVHFQTVLDFSFSKSMKVDRGQTDIAGNILYIIKAVVLLEHFLSRQLMIFLGLLS